MIIQEFKRLWRSKLNFLILLGMLILTFTAYMDIANERNGHLEMIEHNISQGYDVSANLWVLDSISGGLMFFEGFLFRNTATIFFILTIFLIGAGINVCSNLFQNLRNGYGSSLLMRTSYNKYIFNTISAQMLYVLSFISLFFIIVFISFFVVEGGSLQLSIHTFLNSTNTLIYYLTIVFIICYIILAMSLLISVSSLSYVYLKNRYILQFLPVALLVGAYIFAFIFGNISSPLNFLARALIFEHAYVSFIGLLSWTTDGSLTFTILYPLILFVLMILLAKKNISKFGNDYL